MRVDSHVHVLAKPSKRFPRETTEQWHADYEAPVERLLGEMEANDIDRAVLVQTGGATLEQHAYLRHCLDTYPDTFLGIGLVPTDHPDPAAHMDELASDGKIIGFRLRTFNGTRDPLGEIDLTACGAYPIWKNAADKDYVLWLYLQAADVHLLPHFLERFPQVRVVLNHLGICPSLDEKLRPHIETPRYNPAMHTTWRLAKYENVVVHLSGQYAFTNEAYPYRDIGNWNHSVLGTYGSKRTMWATDFPCIADDPGYEASVKLLYEVMPNISAEARADIMGETARRFLRFR
ncbi:MAG: amidohydrolase family protein [Candidatus Poribacteria bacterium]|nr:amidohydrolase family protein [Candidatus Poribacteria bacterium]